MYTKLIQKCLKTVLLLLHTLLPDASSPTLFS